MTAEDRYLSRVKRGLVCAPQDREDLLDRAKQLLSDFTAENPGADDAAIHRSFGPPEEFAQELTGTLAPGTVDAARRKRRFLRNGLFASAVVLSLLLSLLWFFKYQDSIEVKKHAYIISGPNEITEEDIRDIQNGNFQSGRFRSEGWDEP